MQRATPLAQKPGGFIKRTAAGNNERFGCSVTFARVPLATARQSSAAWPAWQAAQHVEPRLFIGLCVNAQRSVDSLTNTYWMSSLALLTFGLSLI
jgi:hypothetical protein